MPRISQLPSLTTADNADEIAIVDVSASTTKKITRGDLLKAPLPNNSVTTASITNSAVNADKIDFATFIQNGITWLTGTGAAFITGGSVTFPRAVPIANIKDITLTNIGYKNTDPTGIGDAGLTIWESPQIGIKLTISGSNITGFTYTIGVQAGTIPSGRRVVFAWSVIG